MGLKCRITYSSEGTRVLNEAGQPSELYQQILERTNNDQLALEIWATAYTDDFGNKGEEASIDELIKYFDETLATKMNLNDKEVYQVEDFMKRNGVYSLSDLGVKLQKIFKPNGLYGFDVDEALNSEFFSEAEINNFDVKTVVPILRKIQGHLQSKDILVEPDDSVYQYKNTSHKTIFGTFEKVSQKEIDADIIQAVNDFTDVESFYNAIKELPYDDFVYDFANNDAFAKQILNRFKDLKKIPVLSIGPDGKLTDKNTAYFTTLKNTVGLGQESLEIEADIEYLASIPQDVWDENPEAVEGVLKEVEKEFVKYNIDIVGVHELSFDRGGVTFLLDKANAVLNNPTAANIIALSEAHGRLFPQEVRKSTQVIEDKYTGYNIVAMHSNLSQSDLFVNHGLIKIGENLYHKVGQTEDVNVVKDYIYEEFLEGNITIPSKYILTKDKTNKVSVLEDISRYLASRPTPNIDNRFSELYSAYQVAFDHSPLKQNVNKLRGMSNFKGDSAYLKSGFVSDFYNEVLKEKAENTELYRNKLSKFEVNDRDITLIGKIDSLSGIPMANELQDYIRMKKDSNMDYLLETSEDILSEDLIAVNQPSFIKEYPGDIILDKNYVITKPIVDNYVKINNEIYRKVQAGVAIDVFLKIQPVKDEVYYSPDLNFEFDRTEVNKIVDKYKNLTPSTIDYMEYENIIAKSKMNNIRSTELRSLSTLKDNSYTFFEVNDSIVAYKDGKRVGSIRVDRVRDGYADEKITVSEIHRGKGIGTELYLRLFDKMERTGKKFYPAPVRTKQAENIFSRVKDILTETEDGGYVMQETTVMMQEQQPQLETPKEILDAVVEKLSQTGLSRNIFTDKQRGVNRLNQLKKLGVVKQQVSAEQVNGFTDGNDIYILNDGINVSIHEHGHLWYSWAKESRPDLISRANELIIDTPYYTQVKESAIYSQMTEEQMLEEAVVQAIGDKGEQIVDNARKTQFEQWLSELWSSIKNLLGISNVTPQQLQDMTMDEFANAVAVDLLRGRELGTPGTLSFDSMFQITGEQDSYNFRENEGENRPSTNPTTDERRAVSRETPIGEQNIAGFSTGNEINRTRGGDTYTNSKIRNGNNTSASKELQSSNLSEQALKDNMSKVITIFDSKIELLNLYSEKEAAEIIENIDSCGR